MGLLNGAQIPTPTPTPTPIPTTAQAQLQIATPAQAQLQIATPENGATAALQQAITNAGARAGHPILQGETPVANSKTKAAPALSDETPRPHRPGAQITVETNPQLRSRAPTTVSAACTISPLAKW